MVKRIIFAIVFLVIMITISSMINSTFRLAIENTLAVEQVEPSDAVAIGINSMERWKGIIFLFEILITLGGIWLIAGKSTLKHLKESDKKE